MKKLTRKAFVAWLRSKPPRRRVGWRGDPSFCPIAKFLDGPVMDVNAEQYGCDGVYRPMPKWGTTFIMDIDGGEQRYLTAGACLKALGEEVS